MSKDSIVYAGSQLYSDAEVAAAGSQPIELYDAPIARAIDTAYIMFAVPDLETQREFLTDFGMLEVEGPEGSLFMRGHGCAPYLYEAIRAPKRQFLGAGFLLESREALVTASVETGVAIEAIEGPGGGERVRLHDPDGFIVDLVHGREPATEISTRLDALPTNTPSQLNRINAPLRPALQPSAVLRFGHYVLMVSDFDTSWRWYRKHLGLLPTDVLCTASGQNVLAFTRLDKGSDPADHHTIVLSSGPQASYMHSAFETCDIDSIGQGQQLLKAKGWNHFWGIGRHILGSQVFDYWNDPHGFEVEHYADGDVFDSTHPTSYHLFDRGGLWAWGEDVPAAMNAKPSLKALLSLLFGGAEKRGRLVGMKKAMDKAPRPWLK